MANNESQPNPGLSPDQQVNQAFYEGGAGLRALYEAGSTIGRDPNATPQQVKNFVETANTFFEDQHNALGGDGREDALGRMVSHHRNKEGRTYMESFVNPSGRVGYYLVPGIPPPEGSSLRKRWDESYPPENQQKDGE